MKAIPTLLDGVQYRSRLEAKWATFFSLCGWTWEYEPIDLNGYIPDFILPWNEPLLVEVKPIFSSDEATDHILKAIRSGWEGEILVLGATIGRPMACGSFDDDASLGVLYSPVGDGTSTEYDPVELGTSGASLFRCKICKSISIMSSFLSFHCRVNGCHDGDHHIESVNTKDFWRDAGNTVQWKGGRS